jgi:uncharacterized protein (TIGR00730 family)
MGKQFRFCYNSPMSIQSVCIYCGSSDKIPQAYLQAAREMGQTLASRRMQLVYGAGCTGIMGTLADAVLEAGGEVVGVIPALFNTPQLVHKNLTRLEVVADMHVRKSRLAELADAFIALPGGFGTLDEWFEVLTWAQIGLHRKPIGLLNTQGYFDPLLAWIEHARLEGFIYDEHRALFTFADQPHALLDSLQDHRHPDGLERWLTREP